MVKQNFNLKDQIATPLAGVDFPTFLLSVLTFCHVNKCSVIARYHADWEYQIYRDSWKNTSEFDPPILKIKPIRTLEAYYMQIKGTEFRVAQITYQTNYESPNVNNTVVVSLYASPPLILDEQVRIDFNDISVLGKVTNVGEQSFTLLATG